MIDAANLFFGNLRGALKDAWFSERDPRRKSLKVDHVQAAFWQATEAMFYARLQAVIDAEDAQEACAAAYHTWHKDLMQCTRSAFDHWVDYNQITEQSYPRRIAAARRDLQRFNYKQEIKKLLELPDKGARNKPAAA